MQNKFEKTKEKFNLTLSASYVGGIFGYGSKFNFIQKEFQITKFFKEER